MTVTHRSAPALAAIVLLSATGCATTGGGGGADSSVEKNPVTCETAAACVSTGSSWLDSGEPETALPRFTRAVSLNDSLAQAHLFLGITHSRLGRAEQARSSFQRARDVEPTSVAAQQARQWLEKLRNPTRLAVVRFMQPDGVEPSRARTRVTETLRAQLFDSGLYDVVQIRVRRRRTDSHEICQEATEQDVAFALVGSVSRGTLEEGRDRSLVDELEGRRGERVYSYSTRLTAHLYDVEDCTRLHTLHATAEAGPGTERREVVQRGLARAVAALAAEVHQALN